MSIKLFSVFLLLFVVQDICGAVINDGHWLNSVYYHYKTGLKSALNSVESAIYESNAILSRGVPCRCGNLTCNCCVTLDPTKFTHEKGCIALTYLPKDLGIKMVLSFDEQEYFSQIISVKNPPPICVWIPYVPAGKVCVRIYDIEVIGYKVHMCVDLMAPKINYVVHFDCFQIGFGGISMLSPECNAKTAQTKPQISQPETNIHP